MHLFQLIHKPVYQGLLFIILTVMLTFIVRPKTADSTWVTAGLAYCCFILANAVLAFWSNEIWRYFFLSIGVSLLYLLVIALVAKALISSLHLKGTEESAMIFIVIILHPVLLLLSIFVKWIFFKII